MKKLYILILYSYYIIIAILLNVFSLILHYIIIYFYMLYFYICYIFILYILYNIYLYIIYYIFLCNPENLNITDDFQSYDYEPLGNYEKYKQKTPITYDLKKIITSLALFYGTNDVLATKTV